MKIVHRLPVGTMIEIDEWGEGNKNTILIITEYIEYQKLNTFFTDVVLYDQNEQTFNRKYESALRHWIDLGEAIIIYEPK